MMNLQLMGRAFKVNPGKASEKLMLIALASHANGKGECFPAYSTLAEECNCSKITAQQLVKSLCEKGLLVKEQRLTKSGGSSSNLYRLVLPSTGGGKENDQDEIIGQNYEASVVHDMEYRSPQQRLPCSPYGGQKSITTEPIKKNRLKEEYKNNPNSTPNGVEMRMSISSGFKEPKGILTEAAERVLNQYNKLFNTDSKYTSPIVRLLKQSSRHMAYTEEDLTIVLLWAAKNWSFVPPVRTIFRESKFDEYLVKARQWERISKVLNPADVVEAFNSTFDDLLPFAELDQDLERKIYAFTDHLKDKNITGFIAYFERFKNTASDFYFGNGFTATLDFLLKPKTLRDTRAGAL